MRPSPSRSVAALILVAAASGCRDEAGAPYDCVCTVLTDFDDASRPSVAVCAPSPDRAAAIARGCVQAPAPVQECACRPASTAAPCQIGACLPSNR